jgi:DNA-binding LacI/PurR family transcriptional regulator
VGALTANNTTLIALNQRLEAPDIACVTHDNVAGATMATQYLLRRGYGPVVYLGRVNSAVGRERYLGYQATLAEAGIAESPDFVWQTDQRYRYEAVYEAMTSALDRGLGMRSVFAGSDELALGAMAAALDRGLKVPQNIALVGAGGIAWGAHLRPSLTTIASDWPAMAKAVREIFVSSGEGKKIPRRTIIEARLVERRSSAAPP